MTLSIVFKTIVQTYRQTEYSVALPMTKIELVWVEAAIRSQKLVQKQTILVTHACSIH